MKKTKETPLFLIKLRFKNWLRGEQWLHVRYEPKVEDRNVSMAIFCYHRDEEIIVTPNKELKVVKTKNFVKDWKYKLYELLKPIL